MKKYTYKTSGTCSKAINFTIDENNIIKELDFVRGCDGNLKGISALCIDQKAEDIIDKFEGITCGFKKTSCPDQLAKALKEIL
jgi:uncharacterized protein (TIGR03905 family)